LIKSYKQYKFISKIQYPDNSINYLSLKQIFILSNKTLLSSLKPNSFFCRFQIRNFGGYSLKILIEDIFPGNNILKLFFNKDFSKEELMNKKKKTKQKILEFFFICIFCLFIFLMKKVFKKSHKRIIK